MNSKKAEFDFIQKNLVYWILIGISAIIIYLIIKGIIKRILAI